MKFRAIAIILAVAGMALAGCVREPDESGSGSNVTPACATDFVTTHWDGEFNQTELREALEEAGYSWTDTAASGSDEGQISETRPSAGGIRGVAELEPPRDVGVRGVVSYEPGTSSDQSLILSFEETTMGATSDQVRLVAQDAGRVVNSTFEGQLELAQWIQDANTAACGEPGGIPPGPG